MAKTYILEPIEVEFSYGEFSTENIILSKEDILAIPQDAAAQIGDTVLKFHSIYQEIDAKPNGVICNFTSNGEEDDPDDLSSISLLMFGFFEAFSSGFFSGPDKNVFNYSNQADMVSGTYTVSIYTETDDPEPAPSSNDISRNFAFSDHSRNDMDGIADIMDDLLGLNKKEPDPVTPDDEGGDEPVPFIPITPDDGKK